MTSVAILLVEDSEDDARIALRLLRRGGYEVRHLRVDSAAALSAALAQETWDAVISDYRMPEFTGLEALKIVRANHPDVPFILISGIVGEEIAVEAIKSGANDYIIKQNLARLPAVLGRELAEAGTHRKLEEQLRQSQRMESMGQLTGGVAHDFNNLLTVILGNAELLSEELEVDARLSPLARLIVEAAERGAQLTQRLLAFARRQPLAPVPVDVNGLIAGMDGLLRRTLGEHVDIGFVRGAGLWPPLVDPAQLESALLNLCINSRDAMPEGGHLTIETSNAQLDEDYTSQHVEVQPGEYVLVAVSDTGCGIAAKDLVRVFEPFYTTKPKGKGTGLGLSMVYGFVKQSRGHVSLYSEPGKGTTVKLYLPRTSMDGEAVEVRSEVVSRSGAETILLVEDEVLVRRYASEQLRLLGYTVIEAGNGAEALKALERHGNIDLLFTDVVMPGMSGRELADAAQRLRPGLRVLYTSGYTENVMVHHGRLDPGVHLLSKPYRRAELADRIRAALWHDQRK